MKGKWLYSLILVSLVMALEGCAPKTPPATGLLPLAAPTPITPASPLSTTLTAEDAAWTKVVEAAKKEGRVTIYTANWPGDVGLAMAKAFQNRYGIRVETIAGRSSDFTERLKTERRMGTIMADVLNGALVYAEIMKKDGLLTQVGDLPSLRDKAAFTVYPLIFNPEGYYHAYNLVFQAFHVNTNLVKPEEEPRTWVDLLDPKWKGKILLQDPRTSASTSYLAILIDQKRLEQDFVQKLGKQDVKLDPTSGTIVTRLARGEAPIAMANTGQTSSVAAEGAPIKAIDSKEGVFVLANVASITKDSSHPNAARLFADWVLNREGQDTLGKARGALSVRKDVPDYHHPAVQLRPQNPVYLKMADYDLAEKVYRERKYVPLLDPK